MEAQLAELPMMDAPPGAAAERSAAVATSLQLAQSGSDEGFRQLLRLHQSRVFSIALRFTGRRTEAEELAQDVFVQLHGALAQIESPAHLTHWLLRAITHRCIDRQRRERRRPHLVPIESMRARARNSVHRPLLAPLHFCPPVVMGARKHGATF